MIDVIVTGVAMLFVALHRHVFETGVLPVVAALGLGGYAELAFDGTEIFLIGAIEITLLAMVFGLLEKRYPVELHVDVGEKRVDMIYTMLNRLGFVPVLVFLLLVPLVDALDVQMHIYQIVPPKLEDALTMLKNAPWLALFFYLVALDFVAYWLHRAQHQMNLWWALHSLHHSQRQMSFWSADRNHVLDDIVTNGLLALVALLIGVGPVQFVIIVVVMRVIESLSHANLKFSFGRFGEFLLVSPRFHRMHHGVGMGHEGSAKGVNFGVIFPLWDVMFKTANFENNYPATGVRDQLDGEEYGRGIWAQQWLGLKRLAQVCLVGGESRLRMRS